MNHLVSKIKHTIFLKDKTSNIPFIHCKHQLMEKFWFFTVTINIKKKMKYLNMW